MRYFYTLIIYLLTPLVLLRLYWLGKKNRAYRLRWKERFGFFDWQEKIEPVIWIHAVSVGEVNAAVPIVHRLLEKYPKHKLLITTVTPTGAATVFKHFSEDVLHRYLPYDLPFSINNFLRKVRPVIMMTMETEIWPNLFHKCSASRIPILIINARLSKKSAKGYLLVTRLMKETLSLVDMIAAQTEADAERFVLFIAQREKVVVTGNLKFDITIPQSTEEQAQSLKRYFSINRPIWIAASTHDGEEELILEAHLKIIQKYKNAILIIAPRHPERVDKIASLCKSRRLKYVTRTKPKQFDDECQVYLLDTLGELQQHYAASQIAFVGGSLVPTGGQNMMEPASLSLPIISGPHTFNFTEVTELLLRKDALIQVVNEEELADKVCELLGDATLRNEMGEAGREVIESNKGNIVRLINLIGPYISRTNETY